MYTFDDLMRAVLAILPDATFGEDNEGQIIIYTNKTTVGAAGGEIIDFDSDYSN